MAHTTLASTDRALEKIGDFVAAHKGAIASAATGFRCPLANASPGPRSPLGSLVVGEESMLHEESHRCACTTDAQGFANFRGLYHHLRHKATFDCCPIGANPCHLVMFRALAERLAMARAPVPSELVEDLENDFPRLMEQRRGLIRDDAATVGP